MPHSYSEAQLEAYLDEALPADLMSNMEQDFRRQPELIERLSRIIGRRDAGVHTLGAIWRRKRLTCPSREELGTFLLEVLEEEFSAYIRFHIETVGCRYCQANLADLQARQEETESNHELRRHRYFQSSAGYLRDAREQ